MSKGKYVNKSMFDCIKLLVENGSNNTEIATYLKISTSTVNRVKRVETYEEYLQVRSEESLRWNRAAHAKKAEEEARKKAEEEKAEAERKAKEEKEAEEKRKAEEERRAEEERKAKESAKKEEQKIIPASIPMSAYYNQNRILEAMKKQTELLELISRKMAYIVEQLT